MVLTDKQRQSLDNAILEYLTSNPLFHNAALAFSEAISVNLDQFKNVDTPILEKKWSSVVRLQRNILSLEDKIKSLEADRATCSSTNNGHIGLKTAGTYLLKSTPSTRLCGHRGPITCVCFHPKFNILASGSEDATIKLWDFESGEFEKTLKGHTSGIQDCVFNNDGSLLATCSTDTSIKLWNFADQDEKHFCIKTLMGHEHSVCGVRFLDDGTKLISCSRDHTLKLWDSLTGYCIKTLIGHGDWARKVAVHLETNFVASCSNDQKVMVWNPFSNTPLISTLSGHEHVVECVEFVGKVSEKIILSSNMDHELNNMKPELSFNMQDDTLPGSLIVASGSRDRTIKVWQVTGATCLFTLSGHQNWVRTLKFQPNGKYLLSGAEDKSIRTWDLKKRRCIHTIDSAHNHFVTALDLHPKLAIAATGAINQDIAVWLAAPFSLEPTDNKLK